MKTNSLRGRNLSIYTLFGLVGLLASSCGSYQNSSYYDNDGVYGSSERPRYQTENKRTEDNVAQSNKYKEYFGSNKDQYSDNSEVFTDVEGYSSQSNDTVQINSNENYGEWGDNDKNITVNYYNTSPGYANYGWGWNYPYSYYGNYGGGWNSYYGSSWSLGFGWGWNSPYYGWGWNSPYYGWNSWYSPYYSGYYYPYYGHHHVRGARGGYAYNGNRYGSYSDGRRGTANTRGNYNTSPRPRTSTFTNPRNSSFENPRNNTQISAPRPKFNTPGNTTPRGIQQQNVSPRPRVNQGSEPRPRNLESPSPRNNNNYSTPRSNNNYSTPRSSGNSSPRSSGGSFGGGGNSGGGGRSGGGRR